MATETPPRAIEKQLCTVLVAKPFATDARTATGAVASVAVALRLDPVVDFEVAAAATWTLLCQVVSTTDIEDDPDLIDGLNLDPGQRRKARRPFAAARHLLGLVEYPQGRDWRNTPIPWVGRSINQLDALERTKNSKSVSLTSFDPSGTLEQRLLLAAYAGNYGTSRSTLALRKATSRRDTGALDRVAKELWAGIQEALASAPSTTEIIDGARAIVLREASAAAAIKVAQQGTPSAQPPNVTTGRIVDTGSEGTQGHQEAGPTDRRDRDGGSGSQPIGHLAGTSPAKDLRRLSQVLERDLDIGARRDEEPVGLSDGLYVKRTVEDSIAQALIDAVAPAKIVVKAEAGHGKSSLLWSLYRNLQTIERITPLLLSAAWFIPDGARPPMLDVRDVAHAATDLVRDGQKAVVLLDTADLLLHDEQSRFATLALLGLLSDMEISWAITTRPREADNLKGHDAQFIDLGPYDDQELFAAVAALSNALCPQAEVGDLRSRIAAAVARGLPAADVCRSPLMLRMVFELNSPNEPSLEVDVASLYRRYWQQRIVTDARTGHRLQASKQSPNENLGALARDLGVLMLAAGTPELSRDSLDQVLNRTPSYSGTGPTSAAAGLETLSRRGVLVMRGGMVRFFHQTMFEYAAAQGLLARGGTREIGILLQRVTDQPADLLTGAVLEQVLIDAAADLLLRPRAIQAVAELLASPHVGLHEIAGRALAYHPHLRADPAITLGDLPTPSLRHLAILLPTVQHRDLDEVFGVLDELWWIEDQRTRLAVIETVARLSARDAARTARFARSHDLVGFAVEHQGQSPAAQRTLPELLTRISIADPHLARQGLLALLNASLSTGERRAITVFILDRLAAVWPSIANREFLDSLVNVITDGQSRRDSDARTVREALGRVLATDWRTERATSTDPSFWAAVVSETIEALSADDESPAAAARLVGIIEVLHAMPAGDPDIEVTWDQLFAITANGPARQLQRSALPTALSRNTAAATTLLPRLTAALRYLGKPVTEPTLDTPGGSIPPEVSLDRMWAEIARTTLTDERVLTGHFLAAIPQAFRTDEQVWMRRDGLIVLTAAAARAGIPGAHQALARIAGQPNLVDKPTRNLLLDRCAAHAVDEPTLVGPTVLLAVDLQRVKPIQDLANNPNTRHQLREHAPLLMALIGQLLGDKPTQQSAGARLWFDLIAAELVPADLNRIQLETHRVTSPEATANLIRILELFIRHDQPTRQRCVELCTSLLQVNPTQVPHLRARTGKKAQPVVLDACRDAWLELAAFDQQPDANQWTTIRTLALAPRLTGRQEPNLAGFGNAARVISQLVLNGNPPVGIAALGDLLDALQSGDYSDKQIHGGTHRLRSATRTCFNHADLADLEPLLKRIQVGHPAPAALIARTAIQERATDLLPTLRELLTNGLDPDVVKQINNEIRLRDRMSGSGVFAEVLADLI